LRVYSAACLTFTGTAGVILIWIFLQKKVILISNRFVTGDFDFDLKSLFDFVILILDFD